MSLEITSIDQLDTTKVQDRMEIQKQLAQEASPTADFKHGVLSDLLCQTSAILDASIQENIDVLRRAQSPYEIVKDPTLADTDIVDSAFSSFNIVRNSGVAAVGNITIVVSKLATVTISAGSRWQANGKVFTADSVFVGRTSEDSIINEDTDKLLIPTGDGKYAFTISVTAASVGADGKLTKGTLLLPDQKPLNFVKAFATSDFTAGEDLESNAELYARLEEGLTPKIMSGRVAMVAALKDQASFSRIVSSSFIGYGDAEMLRDSRGIWPVSTGARIDWYIRTRQKCQLKSLTVTATLKEKTSDGKGIWQFLIDRDDAPGFYDIVQISPADNLEFVGSYAITSDTRGYDISDFEDGPEFIPDVTSATEAAYTRFQTATVRFKDSDTDTDDLTVDSSTGDYTVVVRMLPLIDSIQDYVSDRGVHNGAADTLIKAAIPCFTDISFTIKRKDGTTEPNTDDIKNAISSVVNEYGFRGRLPASVITDTIHDYLEEGMYVSSIDLVGKIRRPSGSVKYINSKEILLVPDEPENMVSSRTTVFFTAPENISISHEIVSIPEI